MDQSEREPPNHRTSEPPARAPRQRGLTIALLFVVIAGYSALRTPVPAANEPHYLTKAKHFWNPAWGRGDLFLESSNPHFVFYTTVGSLTQWYTLTQTAWISRVFAWLLLAVGMESLLSSVLSGMRAVFAGTVLYLGMAAVGNLAGEWIVGGVEGKVFAYGFALWAAGLAARSCWLRPAALLGMSVSFHPVVGIWCLCATAAGVVVPRWLRRTEGDALPPLTPTRLFTAAFLFVLCALPGLIPAFRMLGDAPPDLAAEAARIQVFGRLRHHLDPAVFPLTGYACYAVMLVASIALHRRVAHDRGGRFLHWYLMGTVLIAAGGLAARFGWHNVSILKFYPFRLFDALMPLATAVLAVRLFEQWTASRGNSPAKQRMSRGIAIAVCTAALAYAFLVLPVDHNPDRLPPELRDDWLACCRWVSQQTPVDAQLLTPSSSWGFKWYGERAEYVNYKDCPQDARSLLEWRRRFRLLHKWERDHGLPHGGEFPMAPGTFSRDIFEQFEDRDLVDFVIARTNDKTDLPVAFHRPHYSVYDVRPR